MLSKSKGSNIPFSRSRAFHNINPDLRRSDNARVRITHTVHALGNIRQIGNEIGTARHRTFEADSQGRVLQRIHPGSILYHTERSSGHHGMVREDIRPRSEHSGMLVREDIGDNVCIFVGACERPDFSRYHTLENDRDSVVGKCTEYNIGHCVCLLQTKDSFHTVRSTMF